MIARIPGLIRFVVIAVLLALLFLVVTHKGRLDPLLGGGAQIVVLFVTVIMLVVVWVQLAVQTVIGVLATAQDQGIRLARDRLFAAEDARGISLLMCSANQEDNQWEKRWRQDADRVSQSWNTVGYLLHIDPVANLLLRKYIAATRRTILKSRNIAQPRIAQRRDLQQGGQPELWEDFDWLARKAAKFLKPGELQAWKLPHNFPQVLRSWSLKNTSTRDEQRPQSDTQAPA